jgi:archaellum component FlaC
MITNEQFAETIHGLFAGMILNAGISLPAPDRIEEMRRTSSTLARILTDRVKLEAIDLIKMLQDATLEGFNTLEDEIKFLTKKVEDLQDEITKLKEKSPKITTLRPTYMNEEQS